MKKSVFCIAALAAFMLLFAGCSNSSGGDSGSGSGNGTDNTPKAVEKVISAAEGGEVKAAEDVTITIPAGALDNDTTISVTYYNDDKDISKYPSNFLGGIKFGPDGTVFNTPVDVKVKLNAETSETSLSVFCYDEEEDIWDFVTAATVEDGYANFSINHFSIYELQEKFPTKTDKFVELVDTALATGQSDDWIMSKYTNYLINEEKVLDGYKYYAGYYFEPCGIHISGDYHVNGKENKASMFNTVGTSNMVGNKYGYSWIESGNYSDTISHKDFKDRKAKVTESQKLYSSFFIIDYQMIEPKIELKADKTSLKRGESATVEVSCYYNGQVMNGYELELKNKLTKFTTSVKKVVTDANGKATFKVTAIDKGKEYVAVQFYRTGYLTGRAEGVYSVGELQFTCEEELTKIKISGHIEETCDFKVTVKDDPYIKSSSDGTVKVKVEYDFDGYIEDVSYMKEYAEEIEDGDYLGQINFSNYEATVSGTSMEFEWYMNKDNHYKAIESILNDYDFEHVGVNFAAFLCKVNNDSFIMTGDGAFVSGIRIYDNGKRKEDGVLYGESYHNTDSTGENIQVELNMIYSFPFKDGTFEEVKQEFKDDYCTEDFTHKFVLESGTTKQTTTVKLIYGDEEEEAEE